MILLSTKELVPGQIVARDIIHPAMPQMTLLKAGHLLTRKTMNALHRFRFEGVWVVDDDLVSVNTLIPEEAERKLRELVVQSYALWTSMERDPEANLPVKPFEIMAQDTLSLLRRIDLTLFPWMGDYLGEIFFGAHPAYVCLLGLALYRRIDEYVEAQFPGDALPYRIATLLGMGALLHDIGNLRVPRHLLMELGALTPAQLEDVRKHTKYGYEMLHYAVGPHPALVALHHHQNYNGSGYPKRRSGGDDKPLAGHRIPIFARLVSIVDTYVTLTAERPYSDAMPTLAAVRFIRMNSGILFDPMLSQALLDLVPPFLPGRRVGLSNGFQAVIASFAPERPERPIVRTVIDPSGNWLPQNRREDLALTLHEDIQIVSYHGVPLKQPGTGDVPPSAKESPDAEDDEA